MKQLKKVFALSRAPASLFFTIVFIILPLLSFINCTKNYDGSDVYFKDSFGDDTGNYSKDYNRETEAYSGNIDEPGNDKDMSQPDMDFLAGEGEDKNRDTENGKQDTPEKRMKVYFGYVKLRVDNVKETRSAISLLTDEVNGYVEASYEDTIIIRIPKELFTEILAKIMNMGEVLNKSIETYDVTEIFQDLAARLEISKKTRDRLYALLEKTKDVKERLKILKEIRRLSEEIEKISITLTNIKRLISFSRITVQLEQRLTDLSYEDKGTIPFPWIADLDPFYISLSRLKGTVILTPGDEFAVFHNKDYFYAESTEGVRIRIASTKNRPEGDAGFWQKAVEYHLSRFYKKTEFFELHLYKNYNRASTNVEEGSFKAVQFMSKDADPFYYIVGVVVKKKKIFVCEVLFPNQESFDDLGEAVKGYIKEGRIQ